MNAIEKLPEQDVERLPINVKPSTMDMISEAVMRGAPVEVVDKLMALHERWEGNQAKKAYNNAFADAKREIPVIGRDQHVGFESKGGKSSTSYAHETLAGIASVVDPILGKHGLSYRFRLKSQDKITVTCILSHRDGHSEETELSAPADTSGNKNSIQAIGSTVTYLQRYTLKAALGLASGKDDDARSADYGPRKISRDQVAELQRIASENVVNIAVFCERYNIDGLSDIRFDEFDNAKAALERAGSRPQNGSDNHEFQQDEASENKKPTANDFPLVFEGDEIQNVSANQVKARCLGFIKGHDNDPDVIKAWWDRNIIVFRQFHGINKPDCLAIKTAVEKIAEASRQAKQGGAA